MGLIPLQVSHRLWIEEFPFKLLLALWKKQPSLNIPRHTLTLLSVPLVLVSPVSTPYSRQTVSSLFHSCVLLGSHLFHYLSFFLCRKCCISHTSLFSPTLPIWRPLWNGFKIALVLWWKCIQYPTIQGYYSLNLERILSLSIDQLSKLGWEVPPAKYTHLWGQVLCRTYLRPSRDTNSLKHTSENITIPFSFLLPTL